MPSIESLITLVLSMIFGAGGITASFIQAHRNKTDNWATYAAEMRRNLESERDVAAKQVERLDTHVASLQRRVDERELLLVEKQAGVRARDTYVAALRDQIYRQAPPPPLDPPIPY